MKNIYELSETERSNYRKKFNNFEFTKNINFFRKLWLITIIICLIYIFIPEEILTGDIRLLKNICIFITIIAVPIYIVFTIYLRVAFVRWLKIKHNIQH